ncbi:alanyl-tRNA editing protein [Candidatus Bathyarchaeota archaeon]|nr:alanyl-tRNA editing protein [Candidatus Bathyarchaeota archaeon]
MKLADLVRGLPATRLLYQDDSYLRETSCTLLRVEPDERRAYYVITDQSIFHPKSGGQPSDIGRITGDSFALEVKKAMFSEGVVIHWGKIVEGEVHTGPANLSIDWGPRYRYMRRHTAAHLFDSCLAAVMGRRLESTDSWVGDDSYVGYRGASPNIEQLRTAEKMENELIEKGADVTARVVERNEIASLLTEFPSLDRLPTDKGLRIVTIEGFQGIPCGGTHVRNISEIGRFQLKPISPSDKGFRVDFDTVP